MKIEFIDADYVDVPLDREFSIAKGLGILERANEQAVDEEIEANVEYQLVENGETYYASTIELPQEDMDLLADIAQEIEKMDAEEEEKEELLTLIQQAFPGENKGNKKEKPKKTVIKKESKVEKPVFQVEFLGPEEAADILPLQELLTVDQAVSKINELNKTLEEQEDSMEIAYQLVYDETIYFQSSLFLAGEPFTKKAWKKEIDNDLTQSEIEEEELQELNELLTETFGTDFVEKKKLPQRKIRESRTPLKEKQEKPKLQTKNKLELKNDNLNGFKKREKPEKIMQDPAQKVSLKDQVSHMDLREKWLPIVLSTMLFLMFLNVLLMFLHFKTENNTVNAQSEISVEGQVSKDTATTFTDLFLRNYFKQTDNEESFQTNISYYVDESVSNELKRQEKEVDTIYSWEVEKDNSDWFVRSMVSYKNSADVEEVTVHLKEDSNKIFTVAEVPQVEKTSFSLPK